MDMISVIIPAYNHEKFIEKSINSIFNQTLSENNYEIIVINDGSSDNTLNILHKYQDRIELINQENRGLVPSINLGIKRSKGNYIIRLDADDYFDKNILKSCLKILKNNPDYHCVYTDRYEININDKNLVNVGKNNIFDMIACGILFRREVFNKIGLYRNLLFEEYDYMIRFFNSNFKGYYLEKTLYYYSRHGSSMTKQKNYWKEGWNQLLDLWGEKELKRYIDIEIQTKGASKFQKI